MDFDRKMIREDRVLDERLNKKSGIENREWFAFREIKKEA